MEEASLDILAVLKLEFDCCQRTYEERWLCSNCTDASQDQIKDSAPLFQARIAVQCQDHDKTELHFAGDLVHVVVAEAAAEMALVFVKLVVLSSQEHGYDMQ